MLAQTNSVLAQDKNSSITVGIMGGYTGLWLQHKKEGATIGLVLDEHMDCPYIVIWDTTKHALPFAVDQKGVQLPRVSNDDPYRRIDWEDLYNLVQATKDQKGA